MTVQAWIGIAVGAAAVTEDLGRRQVSNWTSGGAVLGGLAIYGGTRGWHGLADSALGAAVGFGVFLIFYLLSGMGGGDVKLMAGFGALLGVPGVLYAALLAAAAGGILAVAVLAVSRLRRRRSPRTEAPNAIPYAPAIVAGAWLTLIAGV